MSSWGTDPNALPAFYENYDKIIVLTCRTLKGYFIRDLSMHRDENEILVEGPSFFKVIGCPRKEGKFIHVNVLYLSEESRNRSYLTLS